MGRWKFITKPNDNLSIGISGFGVYSAFSYRENINIFAVDTSYFRTASNSILNYQDIWSLSILIKFGIAYQNDLLKLGLTVTSPQISFYGHSKVAGILNSQNVLTVKQNQSNAVIPIDFTADDRQQDLKTKYVKPLSVGFGAEVGVSNNLNIAIAAEYFAPLSEYTVVQPSSKPFLLTFGNDQRIETNSAENLKIVDEYRAILNYGIAFEYLANQFLKTYFSFRTDFNNGVYKSRNNYYLGFSEWDIFHFTLGTTFIDNRSNFSVGFGYSFSFEKNYNQLINLSDLQINDGIFLFNNPGKASVNYQDLSIILGYTYNLE